ncbi:MAG TPA: chloride channel protein [Noviherbaspirillum sp.]|nr:chloride channel protein [Noviherbaspirillum sp.]
MRLIKRFLRPARIRHYGHHGSAWGLGSLLIGLVAVGLASAGEYVTGLNRSLTHAAPFAALLLTPAGFALCALLGRRYFGGTQGSGIPQTIAAINTNTPGKKSTLLSLRIAFGKVMLTVMGLAAGASIGREGPTVQIGASIMHSFFGRGPFQSVTARRTLILAGGAAGIAAAFNTPLAGIMFAIEELSKEHVFKANSSVLITVIMSGLISLALLGNYTYFGSSSAYLDWQFGLSAVFACGLAGGIGGGLFSRLLLSASFILPSRLAAYAKHRPVLFAALCGLGVALLGLVTDGMVYGTGYEASRGTLETNAALPWHFGIAKMAATLLSSMSGIPGGIFAPSLAVGAGLGDNVAALLPTIAPHGAIILLSMAAYLSGVTRAPLTSFIIMMEMTNSHHMLLPLMAATLVASGISKLISPTPLYHALADRFLAAPQKMEESGAK